MNSGPELVWCEARLTNHAELVARLGLEPGLDDAAVVAEAVARWGDDAPRHLLGAFAYAVSTHDGTVITRDALGVMPAYWARDTTGRVQVSDTIASLVALDWVDRTPDERYLAAESIWVVGLCPDRTAMVGVHRVPPGTTVHTGGGQPVVNRWWNPGSVPVRRRVALGDAAHELRDLLAVAVHDHLAMVSRRGGEATLDGVAAHVSGGLDSTAVAFLAADVLAKSGRSLRAAVSWSPQRSDDDLSAEAVAAHGFDERDLIERLAGQLGAPAWFGPGGMKEAPWLAGSDPASYPRSTIVWESWAAKAYDALGVTHVLSGWGGDEFASFNGRGTNRAIVRSLRVGAMRSAYRDRRRRGQPTVRALAATVAPGIGRRGGQPEPRPRLQRRLVSVATTYPDLHEAYLRHDQRYECASGPRDIQLALVDHGHLSQRIESWHHMAVRFGFEYGYPLLDRRLVEWALGVPPETFRDGDHSRRTFRVAIGGIVPDEVRATTKADPVLFAHLAAARAALGDA